MKFAILMMAATLPAFASGTRGGGDPMALDFQRAALRAAQDLMNDGNKHKVDLNLLQKTINDVNVLISDEDLTVHFKGIKQNSTAVNDIAENLVALFRPFWGGIVDEKIKRATALHEVLSLMKLESTGRYPISQDYLISRGYRCSKELACSAPPTENDRGWSPQSAEDAFDVAGAPNEEYLKGASFEPIAMAGPAKAGSESVAFRTEVFAERRQSIEFIEEEDLLTEKKSLLVRSMGWNGGKSRFRAQVTSTGVGFSLYTDGEGKYSQSYYGIECRRAPKYQLLCAYTYHRAEPAGDGTGPQKADSLKHHGKVVGYVLFNGRMN